MSYCATVNSPVMPLVPFCDNLSRTTGIYSVADSQLQSSRPFAAVYLHGPTDAACAGLFRDFCLPGFARFRFQHQRSRRIGRSALLASPFNAPSPAGDRFLLGAALTRTEPGSRSSRWASSTIVYVIVLPEVRGSACTPPHPRLSRRLALGSNEATRRPNQKA